MTPRLRRATIIGAVVLAAATAVALVLSALRSNLVFFYSPSQMADAPAGRSFRVGGLVEPGSVQREGTRVQFVVTDTVRSVSVRYDGLLPDLFKEGKGVVAQGRLQGDWFVAREVLAKHDENYMPPEAAQALEQAAQRVPARP